ncbi:response regulator transcription factor [Nonomuraea sp. NN258]|nr:response regulator transcription factor [Nonomuraea antri]
MRVLIVDDHPLFRHGLRAALESSGDIEVVAEAGSAAEIDEAVARHRPTVVIMDLGLPGASGVEATRRLAASDDAPPVLILTMSDDDGSLVSALQAGARGYLVKGAGRDSVLHAVHTVAAGGAVFGPDVAHRISRLVTDPRASASQVRFPMLTAREREVLTLAARGYNNHRIAAALVLSEKTVRNHIGHIFDKLQVTSRAEALALARDGGLGEP